jgi:hypothetical protein
MAGSTVRRAVLVLCVAGLVAVGRGQVQDDHALLCFDGPFEAVLLDGCVDDCRSFETLEEAEEHCNALGYECGGITKTAYGDEDAISLGVGLYEVRSGPGIEQQQGDMTWIKQDGCTEQAGGTFPSSAGGYASDQNYDERYATPPACSLAPCASPSSALRRLLLVTDPHRKQPRCGGGGSSVRLVRFSGADGPPWLDILQVYRPDGRGWERVPKRSGADGHPYTLNPNSSKP